LQVTTYEALIASFASLALSSCLTPLFRRLAIKVGIIDQPNQHHKTHSQPVPYLGGISIIFTVVAGLVGALFLRANNFWN